MAVTPVREPVSTSGYVSGADGRRYVFSRVSNSSGSTPRPVENTLVTTLAGRRC